MILAYLKLPYRLVLAASIALAPMVGAPAAVADTTILNVSYDVARELYKDINRLSPPPGRNRPANGSRSTSRTAVRANRQCP